MVESRRLNSHHYYILVAENGGGSHDEELNINLNIPLSVQVITPSTLYIPDDQGVLDILMESNKTTLYHHAMGRRAGERREGE